MTVDEPLRVPPKTPRSQRASMDTFIHFSCHTVTHRRRFYFPLMVRQVRCGGETHPTTKLRCCLHNPCCCSTTSTMTMSNQTERPRSCPSSPTKTNELLDTSMTEVLDSSFSLHDSTSSLSPLRPKRPPVATWFGVERAAQVVSPKYALWAASKQK